MKNKKANIDSSLLKSNINMTQKSISKMNFDLSKKDILHLKEVFQKYNLKNQEGLSPLVLRSALSQYSQFQFNQHTIYDIIAQFDSMELGEIRFLDFLMIANPVKNQPESRSEVKKVFENFDRGKKGYLDIEDLIAMN